MKYFLLALLLPALISCTLIRSHAPLTKKSNNIFITDFDAFGPAMYSLDLLGYKHWSWNRTGGHIPKDYPIKVVIYKNVSLESVKKAFPIIPEKEIDFRYVEYRAASLYFEKTINRIQSELSENPPPEEKCLIHLVLNPTLKTAYLLEKKLGDPTL